MAQRYDDGTVMERAKTSDREASAAPRKGAGRKMTLVFPPPTLVDVDPDIVL